MTATATSRWKRAFKYAKAHDSFAGSMEHPQYVSTPIYLGKDLAFDYLPVSGLTCSYAIMTGFRFRTEYNHKKCIGTALTSG